METKLTRQSFEYQAINKGLGEKKYELFYIGWDEYVFTSFISNLYEKYHSLGIQYFFNKEFGWKPNYKLNSPKAKEARILGSVYLSIYELCKEAFLLQELVNYKIPYKEGFTWFGRCCRDFVIHMLIDDRNRSITSNKKDIIDDWRLKLRTLKTLEFPTVNTLTSHEFNPFLKYGDQLIGLITLIEVCYRLASIKPSFYKQYWQPFLDSIHDYIKYIENDCKLYEYSIEKKSDVLTLTPPEKINVSTRGNQKGGANKKTTIQIDC